MLVNTLGTSIEDLFFYEKDQGLIAARKKLEAMQETQENLAKVSGIRDPAVLEKLIDLEIRPETLATLFVIPLVEVAWADGELQDKERDQLILFAEKNGLRNTDIDPKMVGAWLKKKPDPALMAAWELYIRALSAQLSGDARQSLKEEVLGDARAVAVAAGGFLGFGKLSPEEQRVLDRVAAAFG